MKNKYNYSTTTISYIRYHFIFCPRYRKKIFLIPKVEERFTELVKTICSEHNIKILALECCIDHVYLYVDVSPQMPIPDIMRYIKRQTSKILRKEFEELSKIPSLWTKNYFVSTAETIDPETIEWYVNIQRTRY